MKPLKRIGILTGGGGCPGLGILVRSIAAQIASGLGTTVLGILDGFEGLVEGKMREISSKEITGGLNDLTGLLLGTSTKGDPFHFPVHTPQGIDILDCSEQSIRNYREWNLDAIIAIGGDGTMQVIEKFSDLGLNFIGVPKTVDNDLGGTDVSFGYDSALSIATEAIDRLSTTASSEHQIVVVEVTGRYAGWVALGAGVAAGADSIVIPEIPFRWEKLCEQVAARAKRGFRYTMICVAEGARPLEASAALQGRGKPQSEPTKVRGIGDLLVRTIAEKTGRVAHAMVLGNLQRTGHPTTYDRVLASKFGAAVVELARQEKYGRMVSLRGTNTVTVPIREALERIKTVPLDSQLITIARTLGVYFGD